MSVANLEKPTTKTQSRPTPVARTRPAPRPKLKVRVQYDERRASRSNPLLAVVARGAMMATAFVVTFAGSSLWGQLEVEKARRTEISAIERAREARKSEASLRAKVDALTRPDAVHAWASLHGFDVTKPQEVKETPKHQGYVARR